MTALRALPTLVRDKFKSAQESGDLTFFATQVSILLCNDLPFQLRFSPALANKPRSNKPKDSKAIDPFENPPKGLFISDVPPFHYLVLNKFPVIPDHFILATKSFKEQTDLLEEEDLGAAYECLKAYRENGKELFGFFNSEEHSGASQPHRHIQFLPVNSMRSEIDENGTWSVLADSLLENKALPFTYFVSEIPADATPKQLHSMYMSMHQKAVTATQQFVASFSNPHFLPSPSATRKEESAISYNLGLTDRAMVLCPRTSEGPKIKGVGQELIGPIALNGTVLGGTLLVKNEEEWQALRNDQTRLRDILKAIGIPSPQDDRDGRL
ncbi:hypothetical protein G7Y89_g3063 [Cudoniella acicularis]|uniref:Uncharacterized protein n=1 Tax=Cudoniella acicularis TaxID=354080 RepID=A0A8H4RSY7_9HELO|nr:hypothetical protein G7Y89_g3063 [Cudoniella acicularis]